jgi:DNA-binding MarR family transcriptional regulator
MRDASNAGVAPRGDLAELPCACATIRRASRAVTQLYDSWLRRHGIEGPQFAVLAMLDHLGACNQATLGRLFDLDKTTLSRNLKLLKQKGWIAIAAGADARERRVALTLTGRRRLVAARPAWRKAQAQLRATLGDDAWNDMWKGLRALTHAAQVAQRGDVPQARATP